MILFHFFTVSLKQVTDMRNGFSYCSYSDLSKSLPYGLSGPVALFSPILYPWESSSNTKVILNLEIGSFRTFS